MGSTQHKYKDQLNSGSSSTQYKAQTGVVPPADVCYVFDFNMTDPSDEISSFTYNSGGDDVDVNYALSNTEANIESAILAAFAATPTPISCDDVTVVKTSLGGGLFNVVITIKNPNYVFDLADVSGNTFFPTTTDCS